MPLSQDEIISAEEVNSAEELAQGKATGLWIRNGMAQKGWKIADLKDATKKSSSYLGVMAYNNGITRTTQKYHKPSEAMIHTLAEALEIDENEGRATVGYPLLPLKKTTRKPAQTLKMPDGGRAFIFTPSGNPVEITDELRHMIAAELELLETRTHKSRKER